jgi:hypothetical protein
VPVYLFLAERFRSTPDITGDLVFQFLFRSFYRLDNAGLTPEFKDAYFQLLQKHRTGRSPDPGEVCQELSRLKTRKKLKSLQFSFATKLVATIDPELPIYDSFVASLFGFRPPYYQRDPRKRLELLRDFYKRLTETCRWLSGQPELRAINEAFARQEQEWGKLPSLKQLDFILWAAGKAAASKE